MNDLGDKYIVSSFLIARLSTGPMASLGCISDEPFILVDECYPVHGKSIGEIRHLSVIALTSVAR